MEMEKTHNKIMRISKIINNYKKSRNQFKNNILIKSTKTQIKINLLMNKKRHKFML